MLRASLDDLQSPHPFGPRGGLRHALLCKQATDILRSIGRELTEEASHRRFVCVLMGFLQDFCKSNDEDMVPQKTKAIEEALQLLY